MIVGFSKHGKGRSEGPVAYMVNPKRAGRESALPVVVRGDPDITRNIINSLKYKKKYTSGVLSFAPGEDITPEIEQDIIDRFEQLAFAGLEADRYNILWVRYTHAGHHELHFVTPRVELASGKSLNIKPPGKGTQKAFDNFRSMINAEYGLADPDDPDRTRDLKLPQHTLKLAQEMIRRGEKPPDNIPQIVDGIMKQRAFEGLLKNRSDVIQQLHELGLKVTRQGRNYLTIQDIGEATQKWRLKGALYSEEYNFSELNGEAKEAAGRGERDYSEPDKKAARQFAEAVEWHTRKRAEYNGERYKKNTETNHKAFDISLLTSLPHRNMSDDWSSSRSSKHTPGLGEEYSEVAEPHTRHEAKQVHLFPCGNYRCVKTNPQMPSYGTNGEWRVVAED
ncbi:relaxase/mobilization nuclease domain-containing protein [Bombella sp. TMW 2.2559]|uniref:Relaxase/mobilization nuclease domain-containing protein n=1 Tax=Bombella dulcis TaxID=2967339 RepID=A0ABT3W9F6_9PROT|nr:relaxase/mobilization nuclease domain-containing protein [Bombella dulcis]MCX5615715.1 relaxase/mobilization nuclease domain-containing protein [Bombella dulcis]